jgi:hypothetical protein
MEHKLMWGSLTELLMSRLAFGKAVPGEQHMKRALLVLAASVGLTACTAIQYAEYQRLMTEQQIAQDRIWAEANSMNQELAAPVYWR